MSEDTEHRLFAVGGCAASLTLTLGMSISGGCCSLHVPSYRLETGSCGPTPLAIAEIPGVPGEPCPECRGRASGGTCRHGHHGLPHVLGRPSASDAAIPTPLPKFHPVPTHPVFAPRMPNEAMSPIPGSDASHGPSLLTPGNSPTVIEPIRSR